MLGSWVRAPNGSQVLKIIASLAQLVEHDTLNVGVQGSSPWGSTKGEDLCNPRLFVFMSGIALLSCRLSVNLCYLGIVRELGSAL